MILRSAQLILTQVRVTSFLLPKSGLSALNYTRRLPVKIVWRLNDGRLCDVRQALSLAIAEAKLQRESESAEGW
jgi:hypothetical protein